MNLIPIVIALIALAGENYVPKTKQKNKNWFQKLSTRGRWVLALTIIYIPIIIVNTNGEYHSAQKNNADLDTIKRNTTILVSYGKTKITKAPVLKTTNTIGQIPSIGSKFVYRPQLTLVGSFGTLRSNPYIEFSPNKDNLQFNTVIKNIGNVEAKSIQDKNVLVQYINNTPNFDPQGGIANESLVIYPATVDPDYTVFSWGYKGLNNNPISLTLPSFIYLRINYSYSNNEKGSFYKIFSMTNSEVKEATPEWFNRIESDLKKNNLW